MFILILLLAFMAYTIAWIIRGKTHSYGSWFGIKNLKPRTDTEEYLHLRKEELVMNEVRAINNFVRDFSLGESWSWADAINRNSIYVYQDGIRHQYKVFYATNTAVEHEEVFALRKRTPYIYQLPQKGKVHRQDPLTMEVPHLTKISREYNIYGTGVDPEFLENYKEKRKQYSKSLNLSAFYNNILQQKTSELQDLAYKISEGETVTVYGADYNDGHIPTKKEIRTLAQAFENCGFVVNPINFKTGELTLKLAQ